MSAFWRSFGLLVLGLALALGQPLRALAALPSATGGEPLVASSEAMPCHEAMSAEADAVEAPPCPHCSHGQSGWGCGHCAGCLLGAALPPLTQSTPPMIEPGHGDWRAQSEAAARPLPVRVPTPPPKRGFAGC